VTTQGVAYCWGHNQAGLGDGTTSGSWEPVRVVGGLVFREVTAGDQFTCGLTTDDRAYCWGVNGNGELGIGDITGPEFCFTGDAEPPCSTRPVRVVGGLAFRELDAGSGHVCGVTRDNLAYCWGSNTLGELGRGTNSGPELCFGLACSTRPIRVTGGLAFAGVSGGGAYSCGVTTSSVAYCWGWNEFGQLGIGTRRGPESCFIKFLTPDEGVSCSTRPVPVAGDHAFREVEAGGGVNCGVKSNGVALCWGENFAGWVGDGTTQDRLRPRRVAGSS
jgi:alpha-tubulin suppressor-like RCC1 family protein